MENPAPPPFLPPEPPRPPGSDIRYQAGPPGEKVSWVEQGVVFIVMVIAGFILFLIGGYMALGLTRGSMAAGYGYLGLALVAAVACCLKEGLRGLGVGILLGLGAFLLLLAICSGMKF